MNRREVLLWTFSVQLESVNYSPCNWDRKGKFGYILANQRSNWLIEEQSIKPTKQPANQEQNWGKNQESREGKTKNPKKDLALPVAIIVPVALLDREEAHVVLPAPARRPHGHLEQP